MEVAGIGEAYLKKLRKYGVSLEKKIDFFFVYSLK
jgi:hypothetical protein